MASKLLSFRVTTFRSIIDSGDVSAGECTCLLGTNEAGKTNLLLALWKLNPANDGEIIPLSDYPRKSFVDYESTNGEEIFIRARFELDPKLRISLAAELEWDSDLLDIVEVARKYNGEYAVSFPNAVLAEYPKAKVAALFQKFETDYKASELYTKNEDLNADFIKSFGDINASIPESNELSINNIENLISQTEALIVLKYHRKQTLKIFIEENLKSELESIRRILSEDGVDVNATAEELVLKGIPKFIYYSDYGNLDSEIYLPHVIENFEREGLGERERAKSRSLKVLFEFVRLKPSDIQELGKEASQTKIITVNPQGARSTTFAEPTEEEIGEERENKKKREVLLQSASTKLTQDFRAWWKQGQYRFRFQADGNHFRIWVSDDYAQRK